MPIPPRTRVVRFGPFEADLHSHELCKDGVRIKLHLQPFELLTTLIDHANEVVTRETLKNKLWGSETVVDFDVGLNTAIKKLRDALGDSAESPSYVETLSRRGYRFIAPVSYFPLSEATGTVEQRPSLPQQPWMWFAAAGALGIVALLVSTNWDRFTAKDKAPPVRIRSIAVLPFQNLSGDPAQDVFVDGVTDALITNLAQISSLRVISRTSSMRYKHTRKRVPDVAKELNVDAIVEGTVVKSTERVRVNAQLIQATSDQHLWAGTYERDLGDIVFLQSEIARAIADSIQIQLTPQENARLARRQSVDPQAFEAYLRGRYFLDKWTNAGCRKSIEYFQQAIRRDANYALAYAGTAEAYIVREDLSPQEAFSKSEGMARAALQIDDALPEAHNALAMSLFLYDRDWTGAEKEFRRALAINPNYAMAHQFYGQFQKAMGRQNWPAEVKRAHVLDPLSVLIAGVGQYRASGRYDLAIENMHKKMELEPDSPGLYRQLGDVYLRMGRYQEAETQFQKGFELSEGSSEYLGRIGYVYGLERRHADALKIVDELALLSKRRYVSPYHVALVYVGVGDKDSAFDWLEKALDERARDIVFLNWDDKMASLRSDSRYAELTRRVGLPVTTKSVRGR
jgi:TolB-like protein/DNA-binding winged helix-turn-helix (wHTH) protein/Tfp pilus assembly protein PilF